MVIITKIKIEIRWMGTDNASGAIHTMRPRYINNNTYSKIKKVVRVFIRKPLPVLEISGAFSITMRIVS